MSSILSNWSDQLNVIKNIATNLIPVQHLVIGGAYMLGIMFIFKALFSLKQYGESRTMMSSSTNIKEPLIYLFVGAVILFFPTAVRISLNTTFGTTNILSFPTEPGNSPLSSVFGNAGAYIAVIIQTIGFIAFIRGWMIIVKAAGQGGGQQHSTGKGLMHVFGGILAINIVSTLQIVNNTLYGT